MAESDSFSPAPLLPLATSINYYIYHYCCTVYVIEVQYYTTEGVHENAKTSSPHYTYTSSGPPYSADLRKSGISCAHLRLFLNLFFCCFREDLEQSPEPRSLPSPPIQHHPHPRQAEGGCRKNIQSTGWKPSNRKVLKRFILWFPRRFGEPPKTNVFAKPTITGLFTPTAATPSTGSRG